MLINRKTTQKWSFNDGDWKYRKKEYFLVRLVRKERKSFIPMETT